MIVFEIDNVPYDAPENWETVDTVLKRDRTFDGILATYDATVTFYGAAYDYLLSLKAQGFCSSALLEVYRTDGYTPTIIAQGRIFIADCEFKEAVKGVVCKIKDDTFFAKINSNKGIKTIPSGNLSKNGSTITPAQAYDVLMYDLSNTSLSRTIYSVRVYEAFRWFIDFMTNGTLQFQSDSFNYGGEYAGLCITVGSKFSSPIFAQYNTSTPPLTAFSFEDLYKEVKKKIPICFVIEDPFTNPVFRIETIDYLEGNPSAVSFTDIDAITTKFDVQRLYSNIKVGSKTLNAGVWLDFPENINFVGFKEEDFFTVGECSINNTLDLVSDWVISSNVIQDALQGSQEYDSDLFLLDTLVTDAANHDGRSNNTDYLDVGFFYYNELLSNYQTLNRNNGGFPSSLARNYNDNVDATFQAVTTGQGIGGSTFPITYASIFDAETFDNGNNYNIANYRFTAPDTNVYKFDLQVRFNIQTLTTSGFGSPIISTTLFIKIYDSSNVLRQDIALISRIIFSTNNYRIQGIRAIVMNQGDYAIASIRFVPGNSTFTGTVLVPNTYFSCVSTGSGSGLVDVVDSDNYDVTTHEFNYPLTAEQFETIIDSPVDSFEFYSNANNKRIGRLDDIKFNYNTNLATIKLTSKNSNQ
jgi:hypothetical protein